MSNLVSSTNELQERVERLKRKLPIKRHILIGTHGPHLDLD